MDSLYLTHFGLKEAAFNITPDPAFLYLSSSHREGLAQLSYGVQARKGFIVLTGEVGTGKTTLIHALLRDLGGSTQTALIFSTITSPLDLLRFVCEEFGLTDSKSPQQEMHDYLTSVNEFLLARYRAGSNCALIIDEAQNLSSEVLESIRLLSNFETPKDKLLQILLVGQPELAARLNSPMLRQLKQRVTLRHHLRPLSIEECRDYIVNRLRSAGKEKGEVFGSHALEAIYQYAGGIPRLINVLCDNAMLTAFALEKLEVDGEMVREVAKDLNLAETTLNARFNFSVNSPNSPSAALTESALKATSVQERVTTRSLNGSSVKATSTPAPSAPHFEATTNPGSMVNTDVCSGNRNIVIPRKFMDELSELLMEAMGPMASVVLRDRVRSLGESLDRFPNTRVGTLIDAVSHEILDPSMKRTFQRLAQERVVALSRPATVGVLTHESSF
jgi:general secretion pathway protein A